MACGSCPRWFAHGISRNWLFVELGGQAVFAVVALGLGMRRYQALAFGIVAHGLAWDVWHIGRQGFIPDWYTVVCLVVDVSIGPYVFVRAAAWQRSQN